MSMFSERLRSSIEMRGVTQKWLADSSNTTEATISRYVSCTNNPAILEILADIAKSLNVSSDYLLGITNLPTPKEKVTPEEKILLSCFSKASESDRRVLWALLEKYMTATEKDSLSESEPQMAVAG